jgi:O-antigen ligase
MDIMIAERSSFPARVSLTLLGLACVLPFLSPIYQAPIATFYGEAIAFALGLAAIALLVTPSLWAGVRIPRVSLMFIGFALLMVLQIALGQSIYPQLNLMGAVYLVWAAALAMLANSLVQIVGAERFATVLSWFVVAGSAISAVIGLMQWFGVHTLLVPFMLPQSHGRIYANTGQPNHLANYIFLGLASTGYLWSKGSLRFLAIPVCAILLAVLALSGSRAVWLYAAAFLLLASGAVLSRPCSHSRRILVFSIAIVAGLVAAQWLMDDMLPRGAIAVQTIGERVHAEGLSSPVRLRFWTKAWTMFRESPAFGVGFKEFGWNYFLLTGKTPLAIPADEGIIDNAHNLFFQVGAEFGVAGLIILIGGMIWWGASLRRVLIDPPLWWMLALLAVLGLHSMLEYPLWYAYFLGLFAVILGAAERDALAIDKTPSARMILCVTVVLGAVAFANVYRDYRVMQSLQVTDSGSVTGSGNGSVRVLLDMQRASLFAPFIEFALARRMLLNHEHLADKIVLNARAMRFQPSNDFAYRQALLLAMSGDYDGMRAQWDLAVANYPGDREEALKVAQALEKSGEAGMKELLGYAHQ